MKINTTDKGEILLTEVYSGVLLETDDKETIGICMRDTGFEFNYNGVWYEAKQGIVREMKKEEPKQETLEEAFEKWADRQSEKGVGYDKIDVLQFGAKWQAERMYSEEEFIKLLEKRDKYLGNLLPPIKWFEQFKKK